MASKKNGSAKEPVLTRPMRVSFTDVSSRVLAALENAYGRLVDAADPRLTVLKPSDVADARVQVLDPAPLAAMVTLPKGGHSTLCVHYSPDSHAHHAKWHPVATFFHDQPGRLPRDPVRAQHEMSGAGLAALHVAAGQMPLKKASEHWATITPEEVEAVDVRPIAVEGALVWPSHSGSPVLFICHQGIWWPALRIMRSVCRAPDPPTRAEQGYTWPRLALI